MCLFRILFAVADVEDDNLGEERKEARTRRKCEKKEVGEELEEGTRRRRRS